MRSRDFWDCETIKANDFKRWLQLGKGFPTYGRSPGGLIQELHNLTTFGRNKYFIFIYFLF